MRPLPNSAIEAQRNLKELRRLGLLRRRRFSGDYKITTDGYAYLYDAAQRDDEVREQMAHAAETWGSGEMTEVQREMAQIELVFFALSRDMGREAEEVLDESPDPAAWLEALGLENGLLRDEDWEPLDGEVCRVNSFRPFPDAEEDLRLPYAAIEIESPALAEPTIGYITNQLDFQHVSEAFEALRYRRRQRGHRGLEKSNLHPALGPASRGMPGLVVWLCPKNDSGSPIRRWEPEELR